MARSEESILRRALKRERTEGQQRHADRNEMKRQEQKNVKRKHEQNNKIEDKNKRSRISRVEDTKKREVSLTQAQKEYLSTTKMHNSIVNEEKDDKQNNSNNNNNNYDDEALKEQGAWICTKCQNSNFASRKYCNSKTCDERRPYQIFREQQQQQQNASDNGSQRRRPNPSSSSRTKPSTNKPRERHDEATSKKLAWSKQADRKTLTKNQELRKLYVESNGTGEGMDPEDFKRAKILIERDQRKQEKIKKKNHQNQTLLHEALKGGEGVVTTTAATTTTTTSTTTISSGSNEQLEEVKNSNSISNGAAIILDDNKNQEEEEKKEESKEDNKKSSSSSKEDRKKKKKEAQAKRDQNKALRQLYIDTGGKGMKMDQIERAKLLIARDEKKRNKNEKRAEKIEDE
jgi:hypothetical protein